jgi:hypothetical protein
MTVHSYTIRCYREMPGDADCHDVPAFGDSLEDCTDLAGDMLLAYAGSPKRSPAQRPAAADLLDENGRIAARIRIAGSGEIERLPGPTSS